MSLCTHNSDYLLYNYFSILMQFFSPNGPSFFGHHHSPSNLTESRYHPTRKMSSSRNKSSWLLVEIPRSLDWRMDKTKGFLKEALSEVDIWGHVHLHENMYSESGLAMALCFHENMQYHIQIADDALPCLDGSNTELLDTDYSRKRPNTTEFTYIRQTSNMTTGSFDQRTCAIIPNIEKINNAGC